MDNIGYSFFNPSAPFRWETGGLGVAEAMNKENF